MAVIAWSAAVPLMLIEEGGWMLLEREHQDRRIRTYTFRYPLPCPSSCLEKVPPYRPPRCVLARRHLRSFTLSVGAMRPSRSKSL